MASLFSRLISHFERVPACVLHSVEHSIWLQGRQPRWLHPFTYLVLSVQHCGYDEEVRSIPGPAIMELPLQRKRELLIGYAN